MYLVFNMWQICEKEIRKGSNPFFTAPYIKFYFHFFYIVHTFGNSVLLLIHAVIYPWCVSRPNLISPPPPSISVSIFLTHASSGSFSGIKMLLSSVSTASHPAWVRGDHECREAVRAISCHWIRQMLIFFFYYFIFFPLSPRVDWKYKHVLVPQHSVWKTSKEIKHEGERNMLCKWQRLLQHLASSLVSVVMLFFHDFMKYDLEVMFNNLQGLIE